jgi:hypothetical protein
MTLDALRASLERLNVELAITAKGDLELDAPEDAVLSPELLEAAREHRPLLLAWAARQAKRDWPVEHQVQWGALANELETCAGIPFPESELEAYRAVVAEMDQAVLVVDQSCVTEQNQNKRVHQSGAAASRSTPPARTRPAKHPIEDRHRTT